MNRPETPFPRSTALLVAFLTLFAPPARPALAGAPSQDAPRPWTEVVAWLRGEQDRLAGDLAAAHERLAALAAEAEREDVLARLDPEPPRPRPTGYQLLPHLGEDRVVAPIAMQERRYSLRSLSTAYAADLRDAALLRARLERADPGDLSQTLEELERLRKRLDNLGDHLDYHDYWQAAVVEQADYFAERNRIVADVRELKRLREAAGAAGEPDEAALARVRELERGLRERVAPFVPVPGLRVEETSDGGLELEVRVLTDVADAEFLDAFRSAIETIYNDSEAARARRFRIRLVLEPVAPAALYPDRTPPERGAPIDEKAHVARFPAGALVLTTGASATHAFRARHIQLGTAPTNPRGLAHEFGHLLGFADAYLRGYDGDPDGRFGVIVVEWIGLLDDLMGDLRRPVSAAMIARLVEAYGPGADAPSPDPGPLPTSGDERPSAGASGRGAEVGAGGG